MSKGLFLRCLCSLFLDIAVGAPYEGNGVVFIYHGDKTGIVFEPVQKIFAEKIDPGLNGFGISLSGGVDVDGNHYNGALVFVSKE